MAFSSSGDGYKCVRLLLQAADSGQSEARFFLGWVYFDGHLVDRSLELAIHYWRLAAEQNHAYAQYMLGLAYENGHGVKKNRALAKKYLELSAKQRFGLAREKLAEMKAKTRP
ncbi:MAG: sel1 repeat family protein [Deltaproteobacteria bacterium]|nr:sel1 repeat family protein [Deltaproteobacteria bacterium]